MLYSIISIVLLASLAICAVEWIRIERIYRLRMQYYRKVNRMIDSDVLKLKLDDTRALGSQPPLFQLWRWDYVGPDGNPGRVRYIMKNWP